MSRHAMVVCAICTVCVVMVLIVGSIWLVVEGHKDD